MIYIKLFIKGILIGIGVIIPGVSGGVIASILGIYDKLIYILNNFFKNTISNILYISKLFIGIIIGVLLFSKIILYLFSNHYEIVSYIFIGLILGSIPYLNKGISISKNKISFILGILLGVILYILNNITYIDTSITPSKMILGGILFSLGKILPGISSSILLMSIGIYKYYLIVLSNPLLIIKDYLLFIPFILSFLITSIIIIKLINYLFTKYYKTTYSFIIGISISSILFIYPNSISITYIIIAISSFIISYKLSIK